MAKREAEVIPLSRFGVLVAQLESIVASAPQQPPEALLCFDLLSQLVSSIEDEPKESIQLWQRKCEDALFSLLTIGARRPVRRLASAAMGRIIEKGDAISIYSRASSLQGWLADGKRTDPLSCSGAAQCLGELYRLFGHRITAGLTETANIVSKLMKYYEDYVRQDALLLLENAMEGSGGGGAPGAYMESFRIVTRTGLTDKSFMVRLASARCLKTFASIGWTGLGITELENSLSYCVKGLEDQVSSVRDAFAEALGALLALAVNPDAQLLQIKKRGKHPPSATKKPDDSLHKHLIVRFIKASGVNAKKLRIGLALSWVFFLQTIHLKYHFPDSELQNFAFKAMEMLQGNNGYLDPHALACVLYILRVGVADQMTEPAQRDFLILLGKKLESSDCSPPMRVATLRILSYLLKSLGEVPAEFKDILDDTVVAALSQSSVHVRIEAALTIRALAEVDPTCVGGLISYGVTALHALRESVSFDKGNNLHIELASLHGQATVLAALVSISPKLLLGYPARLPKSVFEVSKKMLSDSSRNPVVSSAVREAGWLLLASLVSSMPKEELEDQVFDVLLLWAGSFAGNPEYYIRTVQDWSSELRVLSVAIEALTAFIKSFISPKTGSANSGILLQPVLAYLSGALSLISLLCSKPQPNVKPALDFFTTRVLMAYQSISDPSAYKSDHTQIIRICTSPFSEPLGWEESSCLRTLLDKRDASLGPWIPGRDSFEDELRAFDGGSDGLLPCVWDNEICSFPQPESISKMLVNQMLLCFGTIFACQDNGGKIALLNKIDQCLKSGKKQSWYMTCITNACVGLLFGLKSMLVVRPQTLSSEILSTIQSIFQGILVEAEISPAQRRATCEGLGLLARVGNDVFTARMTRSILGELSVATDLNYIGSIALSLGCMHRSAGGIALSTLVPSTVSSLSVLSKSTNSPLQLWSLHALLLTIEAAGLSYVPQVQGTLFLVMEILLLDENGYVDLRQEIGHLINAIVAVLGPELAPGSTFFSRCKSVIAEISSCKETATLLESVRFTQQLVLFAPQAATVHSHVQNLIPTLSSRQPSLRYLAVSTLHHLIERDSDAMSKENIEENLFSMLDEETDSEIASLIRTTINQLLYSSCPQCPSRWLTILRNMVLATSLGRNESLSSSGNDRLVGSNENNFAYGEDDEDMISSSKTEQKRGPASSASDFSRRNKYLRYRTRVFAAECLSFVPTAVGNDRAHFDLVLARNRTSKGHDASDDWLVLKLQELVSLSYQISTGQFEGMQPTGVRLLSVIMDKFGNTPDPEFPGHILLEQYQAQFVSAVRSAISTASSPLLLDAGLELSTKILTSSVIGGDRIALNRLYLLISRPLSEIQDLCYPSFADWVACKIKIQLLTAHASVKCYAYQLLRKEKNVPDEYLQLMPLLSNTSSILGKYWVNLLKDYIYIRFGLHPKANYKPFLDGIHSSIVSSKVEQYLRDTWALILQATALDSVPVEFKTNKTMIYDAEEIQEGSFISGRSMVRLEQGEFQFIWGLSMLLLFKSEGQNGNYLLMDGMSGVELYEVVLSVFLSLTKEVFLSQEFVSVEMCQELLQALVYAEPNALVISLLSQILQKCPSTFFVAGSFFFAALELFSRCLLWTFQSHHATSQDYSTSTLLSELSIASETIASRVESKYRWKFATSILSVSYQSFVQVSTDLCLSKVISFLQNVIPFLKKHFKDDAELHVDITLLKAVLGVWDGVLDYFSRECIKKICSAENKTSESSKLLAKIFFFCLQETVSLTRLAHETDKHLQKETDYHILTATLFRQCAESIRDSLSCTNIQVQKLGLHVLKTLAQRELSQGLESMARSSFMLILGELLGVIFSLLQDTLGNCSSRESVTVIDDCLKLLFLFHALGQTRRYKKDVTMLLLEAFVVVLSLSKDGNSQEHGEVNSMTRRMVSHLVQIPSSATQIKDIMLSVSSTQRQQIQDMIRASVNQGQMAIPVKPDPSAIDVERKEDEVREDTAYNSNINNDDEDEDEDEDDWDAFQSLPANNYNNNNTISSESTKENEPLEGSVLDTVDDSIGSEKMVAKIEQEFVVEDENTNLEPQHEVKVGLTIVGDADETKDVNNTTGFTPENCEEESNRQEPMHEGDGFNDKSPCELPQTPKNTEEETDKKRVEEVAEDNRDS